jgi:hypothetical protein
MATLDQLRESIEARIAELKHEIALLEAARSALRGQHTRRTAVAASNRNAGERRRKTTTPRKPRRRSRTDPSAAEKSGKPVEGLGAGTLETMLSESEAGLSAIALSRRANAGYDQVLDLLRKLESAGKVRRTGSRRTEPLADGHRQEQIAERAAELESRSVTRQSTPRRRTPSPRPAPDL